MSKDMNVTIWPLWDNGFGEFYADTPSCRLPTRVDFVVYAKRLSDTELAAEYWAAFADTNACMDDPDHFTYKTHAAIENTIHRFATLPHASDTDYA